MFDATLAGSLPKPFWLAETNKLWPQWKAEGRDLEIAKRDATLLWLKAQEDAGLDIVSDGEQSRQHFVHGFLEFVDGIDRENKVEMGIRNNRYAAMVPQVRDKLSMKGRAHATEAKLARAHTTKKLKFTLPGPMTIVDTVADRYYGNREKMAMALAELLNQEARALEADGVDVIQFDEPAFNAFTEEASTWGIECLHRATDGLKCTTCVHICYGYGIKQNIDWKKTLGGEWRQYESFFPALAKSKIKQWFSRERNEDLVESGRDDLVEELRALGLPVARVLGSAMFTTEIESMNYQDELTLYRAIGEGHVEASALAGRLSRAINEGGLAEQLSVVPRLQHGDVAATSRGVRVEGLDDVFVDLAKCCTPVPGDDIVGFLADGRSVDVHRADCARAASSRSTLSGRMVEVEWVGADHVTTYTAAVEVVALDRSRLLRDVANALSDEHVNIVACNTFTGADRVAKMRFEFEFADPSHLQSVLRTIKRIDSVYDAYRVMAGDHPASNLHT